MRDDHLNSKAAFTRGINVDQPEIFPEIKLRWIFDVGIVDLVFACAWQVEECHIVTAKGCLRSTPVKESMQAKVTCPQSLLSPPQWD